MRFPRATRHCKDGRRTGTAEHIGFDFLGYTFRARRANGRRGLFVGFMPAMSQKARTAVGRTIRAWHLNRRTGKDLSSLARVLNAQIRGWINYYGAFYRSELYSLAMRINEHLVRWAMQKFKRLRGNPTRAWEWVDAVRRHHPTSSPTGTCSRTPPVDLWGPDDERSSRPVLREREGAIPSRHSPEPHARFDGRELETEQT